MTTIQIYCLPMYGCHHEGYDPVTSRYPVSIPSRDVSPSGNLAITREIKGLIAITHVPTGLRIPMNGLPGCDYSGRFPLVGQAREAMLALDSAEIDLSASEGDARHDMAVAIKEWLDSKTA